MIITDKKTAAHEYFRRGQLGLANCDSESAFLAGVEYANTWISIKEKLPEIKNKRYQIHIKYKSRIDIYDTLAIEPSICTKKIY